MEYRGNPGASASNLQRYQDGIRALPRSRKAACRLAHLETARLPDCGDENGILSRRPPGAGTHTPSGNAGSRSGCPDLSANDRYGRSNRQMREALWLENLTVGP